MDRGTHNGFTLIELAVTIAVLGILAAVAMPSYSHFISSNRTTTEISAYIGDLQYARSAAMKNGQPATVCASLDGATCSGAAPWDTGWIVFVDVGADGVVDDALLRAHGSLGNGDVMTGNQNVKHTLTFNRFGMFTGVGAGTVTLYTADDEISLRRCVILSNTGKIRSDSGGDCT